LADPHRCCIGTLIDRLHARNRCVPLAVPHLVANVVLLSKRDFSPFMMRLFA
jgi:hypothetical protein